MNLFKFSRDPGTPPRDPTYFSIFVTITLTLCWLSCPQDAPAASGPQRAGPGSARLAARGGSGAAPPYFSVL